MTLWQRIEGCSDDVYVTSVSSTTLIMHYAHLALTLKPAMAAHPEGRDALLLLELPPSNNDDRALLQPIWSKRSSGFPRTTESHFSK